MVRALYVRTLKPGVTDDEFVASWMPEHYTLENYPAVVTIAHSPINARQVLSMFDVEVDAARFLEVLPDLVRPDAADRLAAIVESTEFEGVFEL